MLRSSARITLEILASLLAGILLLVGIGLWRLSWEEPLRLSFLTPYIEQALQAPDSRFKVEVGDTVMIWEGWGHSIDVAAADVTAFDENGQELAHVPRVSFRLSVRALLHGMVAPTSIAVHQPTIAFRRHADGHWSIGESPERASDTAIEESVVFPTLLEELLDDPDPDRATGYLTEAAIVDASIVVIDDRTGLTWRPERATVVLSRDAQGLAGIATIDVPELGRPARLEARLVYDRATERVVIDGQFHHVELAALGLVESRLMTLANADLLISGTVRTDISLAGELGEIELNASAGPGRIELRNLYDAPLAIESATIAAKVGAGFDTLTVESFRLDLGGPRLALVGDATGLASGPMSLALDVTIENVDFATVPTFWPNGYGTDARRWITENMPEGRAEKVEAILRLNWPQGRSGDMVVEQFTGTVDGEGLTIQYLKPLPPIVNAAGRGIFDKGRLDVSFERGNVGEIQISGGRLQITGIGEDVQWIKVEGTATAPLAATLELLDHPRLDYVSRVGIVPEGATGETSTELHFSFPAKKNMSFADVEMTANATITDANLVEAAMGQPLNDGNFTLALDNDGLEMKGTGLFAGVPLDIRWLEWFNHETLNNSFEVAGWTTAEEVAKIGLALEPFVTGPVGFGVTYTNYDSGVSEVATNLDLVDAIIALPVIDYTKLAGDAGTASFVVEMVGGNPAALRELVIDATGLAATGGVQFDPATGALARVDFGQLDVSGSALTDVAIVIAGPRTDVVLGGGVLNAEPFIGEDTEEVVEETPAEDEPEPEIVEEIEETEKQLPPFTLQAEHLDRIILGDGRALENARVKLHNQGDYWEWLELDGTLGADNAIMVRYVPTTEGTHELAIEAADAGATLSTFNFSDSFFGGRLTITGVSVDTEPDRPIRGSLNITQFRLVNAPGLARLLSVATLTGLVDALTGEGFLFTGLRADFEKAGGRIAIDDFRAHGPSVGVTADGWIDTEEDRIALKGTLVPAYAFNSILGNIPLIGPILQGGEGEGLFAATFSASGKLSEPQFSYNPLAALAPGFLRELFEVGEPTDTPREPAEPVEPTER
ncbi:MAG: AsmA-like C-terminal region-containing protein [Dongiaceae bacterium]